MADKQDSSTTRKRAGCGYVYMTVISDKKIELKAAKNGTCAYSQLNAIGQALSLALEHGATVEEIAERFSGVICQQSMAATGGPTSCADAVSRLLVGYAKEKKNVI